MALREKFGRLVLLDETEVSGLGREYRAARLGPRGFDRLVTVLCFAPPVSAHGAGTKRLMDEARLAARLQNPGLVRVLGIGRVDQTFYVSTELVEGRTLAAILARCSHDSFPFAADHALMVASRAASALEYLHAKKDDAGRALFHGLLSPSRLVVAFDGEVKVKGLGLWPALRDTNLLLDDERTRLAPEQASGAGDPRADVYTLGLVLLEALTGCSPTGDPLAALGSARIVNVTGESSAVPKPLLELLSRALAADPAARFPSMAEMRKAIDTLLFSGDFTPTTFDLAFFMHTLFRDEMEQESKAIEDARRADYSEFMEDKPAAPAAAPSPATEPAAAVVPAIASEPMASVPAAPADSAGVATILVPPASVEPAPAAVLLQGAAEDEARTVIAAPALVEPPTTIITPLAPPPLVPPPAAPAPAASASTFHAPGEGSRSGAFPALRPLADHAEHAPLAEPPRGGDEHAHGHEHARDAHDGHRDTARAAREATRDLAPKLGLESHEQEHSSRRGLWIGLGLVALVAIGAGSVFVWRARSAASTSATTTLSAEVIAAMTRVRELEARILQIEQERREAENRAAEEAKKKLEAQAAARGRAVDPAALARAQEDARQKARLEQERRQQEELARLAEARRTEERRIAEASPSPPAVPPTTAAPAVATAPTPQAAATALPTPQAIAAATPAATPLASAATTTAAAPPTSTPATSTPAAAQSAEAKIVPPSVVSAPPASYPPIAKMRRITGTVELTAVVDETGRVVDVRIVRAAPAKMGFEEAAMQGARQRRYKPATRDGVPIRMVVPIVVRFN